MRNDLYSAIVANAVVYIGNQQIDDDDGPVAHFDLRTIIPDHLDRLEMSHAIFHNHSLITSRRSDESICRDEKSAALYALDQIEPRRTYLETVHSLHCQSELLCAWYVKLCRSHWQSV